MARETRKVCRPRPDGVIVAQGSTEARAVQLWAKWQHDGAGYLTMRDAVKTVERLQRREPLNVGK